ncbi:SMP-30/gluconolactonase/LRE family protein [candidate division KSB1 bacterium]|nr:SMP-30/gluconolactonase/LRE family protein [candidate division KSB1 bacterium]
MVNSIKIFLILLSVCITLSCQQQPANPPTGSVNRLDARLDDIIAPGAVIEQLADGFSWSEGPVWVPDGDFVLFNDIPKNTNYKWKEGEGLSVYLRPAGAVWSVQDGQGEGCNGLMLDAAGQLVMCDHWNRAICRLNTKDFTKTILVDRYQGKRLNSPNDLIYRKNGDLIFTDPPYGLQVQNNNPAKELAFNGVYCLKTNGELTLLTDELTFPNGVELSPDEKTLYVAVSDGSDPRIMAYDLADDGVISNGRVFYDFEGWKNRDKPGLPDGMDMHPNGYLFATGPCGVHVFAPNGDHIGVLETDLATANCTLGNDDSYLYMTSHKYLLRIPLKK